MIESASMKAENELWMFPCQVKQYETTQGEHKRYEFLSELLIDYC